MSRLRTVPLPVVERLIAGAAEVGRAGGLTPRRLPMWTFAQMADGSARIPAEHAAGVRLDCVTDASVIGLRVLLTGATSPAAAHRPHEAVFAATAGEDTLDRVLAGDDTTIRADGRVTASEPVEVQVQLRGARLGRPRRVQVWLPHNRVVRILCVRADREVRPYRGPRGPRWVHYGSSISHCLGTPSPLQAWPVIAARRLGLDLVNLGMSGNALLDPYVARTIRDARADVISIKVGINIVNADAFTVRTFLPAFHGFLDTIRDGHPHAPLLVITPVYCGIHEQTPGPTGYDSASCRHVADGGPDPARGLTLSVIRDLITEAVRRRAGDRNLRLLDGRRLLSEADRGRLYDDLHPDADGYALMAARFEALACDRASPVGSAFHPLVS